MSFFLFMTDPAIATAPIALPSDPATDAPLAIFYGQSGGPNIYLADTGARDGGVRFGLIAKSNPLAPGGFGSECVFTGCYVAIRHTMAVTVRLTPFIDGMELTDCRTSIALPAHASPQRQVIEVGWFQNLRDPLDTSVVVARVFPRGAYAQLLIETFTDDGAGGLRPGLETGEFVVETAELEYEVVRETRSAEPVAA